MTSPTPVQSPFKGSCLSYVGELLLGFAKFIEGSSAPSQIELTAVQFAAQILNQHLQSMLPPAPAVAPEVAPVAPVAEAQV